MENQKNKKKAEENNNIKEHVEDLKDDIKVLANDIKENFEEKSKNLNKELKEKTKDIKKEIKETTEELKDKAEEILKKTKDNSKKFDKKDIEENKAMACLAYIIAPIPYFVETKSKWVKYHSIQGMNLFIINVLLCLFVSIISSLIFWPFFILKALLKAALYSFMVIYAIIGIINVCNCEAKELPIIGKFKFIKK